MQNNDLEFLVSMYFDQGKTMQLATVKEGMPWVCSVYYVYYEGKLYWLSFPTRRHSQNIAENPQVAITVAIKTDKPTIGVQAAGHAVRVSDPGIIRAVMDLYAQKYDEGRQFYDNFITGTNKHVLYQVKPEEVVLFDEVTFPENGYQPVL